MLKGFRSYQLSLKLYQECAGIPAPGYLKDQLCRASLSVVLNLAEGSAKPSMKERKRFYSISMASLREVQAILDILGKKETYKKAYELGAMVYTLARK